MREKEYQASLAAWSCRLDVLTEDVKERIYNVLLFVDGGWMIDNRQVTPTCFHRGNFKLN